MQRSDDLWAAAFRIGFGGARPYEVYGLLPADKAWDMLTIRAAFHAYDLGCADRYLVSTNHYDPPSPEAWKKVEQRAFARHARDYATADRLRAELNEMGFDLTDQPDDRTRLNRNRVESVLGRAADAVQCEECLARRRRE